MRVPEAIIPDKTCRDLIPVGPGLKQTLPDPQGLGSRGKELTPLVFG